MKKLYLLSWLIFACTIVFATEPTVPASNINLSNVQGNSISFYVTRGDGAAQIAIVKLGSPVTAIPQNGNSYYANNTFTEGQEVAPGEFVVYSGSSSYITINGLVAETDYYVSIFEFNGSGASSEYLTSSYLADTITTLFAPDVQPSAFNVSEVDGNLMNVNWDRGTGDGTIVLCKEGAPVNANPVELISYRANSNMHYRGINEASIIGDGNFVLYKGGDTTFTVNNLYPDTDYHFAAFSYNGSSGPVYLTTNPARGNATTLSNPTLASTDLHTYGFVEGDRLQLQWTNGNGTRRIVVAREGAPIAALPQNGTNYTESSYFDQADSIAPGHKVIYDGIGTIAYAYNLKPATTYYFAVFEYSGSGDRIGYLTSEYPTHNESTQAIPSTNVSDIDTIEVTAYNAQLNFTPGDGMGRILVMKEGSPVDYVPTEFVRISSWSGSFGTYGHVGNGNYVVYKGNGSSANVGLSPNKTYYVTAFEYNGTNYPVYNTANIDTFSFTTKLPPAPNDPSRNLWFYGIEGNSLTLQWNKGDGDRRVIIARKDSAVTAKPVNGVQYSANNAFNLAPELAPGHKVVYDGTGYHTRIDSLEPSTAYYFEVIEYNGSGDISNYLLSETLTGARTTAGAPTISSTNIHFKLITLDKLRIYWTRGSGERRLILARENAPVDGVPEDLSTYYSRTNFGGGAKIGESTAIFSGNFYGTDGNNADTVYTEITNINPGNTYHFSIFEYNGNQAPVYKKDNPEIGSFTVTFEPPTPATGFYVSSRDGNQLGMQWVRGGGDRRVIVAREGQPVDAVPQDGVGYSANEDFEIAPEIATGQKVIYDGSGYFGYAKGLDPGKQYFFKIFEYGGTGVDIDYLTSAYDSTDGWTHSAPTVQAANLVVSGVTPESGNVSWTNGDGQRRMAVVKKGSAVSVDPQDTTNYSWNNWFAGPSAYHLGDGNYVSYKGTANNFQLVRLLGGTTYHIAVYEYNGNVGPVLLRPPVTGKFTTLGPPQENAQVLDATLITKNSFQINFIPGSGQKRIIVMREGSPVDSDPVDDVNYIENTYLGAGDSIGSGNYVVYDGEDDNIIITGLTANRTYHFSIFEYNAFNGGTIVNYLIPTSANGIVTTLPDNISPVLDSVENQSINEFDELTFNVSASDDDFPPQQLAYSLDSVSLSLGMTIDPNSGAYSWIPGELNGGIDYPVTVSVTDDGNNPDTLSDSVSFTVSVMETNSTPTLDLVDDQFIDFDSTLTLNFTASDADIPFQILSYSLNQPALDAGMILNSSTGEFNFTPVAAQSGLIYNVALTVTDDGSNPSDLSDTVYFKITVLEDTLAPVIGSVTNLIADNDSGQCGAIVEITPPSVVDNRDEVTAVGSRNDGLALNSEFPVGETLIFWTAEDNSGNKADTVTQKVTVSDRTKPEFINLPADFSISNDSSLCSAFVSWIVPSASDNCTLDTLFSNFQSGSVFQVGESTVIYTAKDIHGNLSIDSFKVTVHDDEPPVPDHPELSPLTADCRITDWISPTATDNCGGQIAGVPDLALPIDYDTTVTWTFTDAYGNRSYQTQEIQIILGVNTWYADVDGDGYGASGTDSLACDAPAGYVLNDLDCDDFDPTLNPTDVDGDGFSSCDGDCDDTNSAIFPGNPEICDGIDNNCDGQVDEGLLTTYYADADGDGFGNAAIDTLSCSAPDGFVANDLDCDDLNATVFPGAPELCDGLDNDCNGETDEGVGSVWYADADGDGYGALGTDSLSCDAPAGYVLNDLDCDDLDPSLNPTDIDGDGFSTCDGDCDDSNPTIFPGNPEICDGIDNNCDGQVDEGLLTSYYADADGDGFGNATIDTLSCSAPEGFVGNDLDCDDLNATVFPGAPELCDGLDNDCNGETDEGVGSVWYADADGDGYGASGTDSLSCDAPAGYVLNDLDCDDFDPSLNPEDRDGDGFSSCDGDCDDTNPAIFSGNPEICDGIDNNCDGQVDEGLLNIYYADADGDGFGNAAIDTLSCSAPEGFVANDLDCDDLNATVFPGAPELCDGLDNDCDRETDEGVGSVWYADADGDGYGASGTDSLSCDAPAGYVLNDLDCDDFDPTLNPTDVDGDGFSSCDGDCDDTNPAIFPGNPEICDGIDNNCDGQVDEGLVTTYYADADGDGFGNAAIDTLSCSAPNGFVANDLDCDDLNATVFPGASELCDGIDNDCDGETDEEVGTVWYADADGDGFGDMNMDSVSCGQPVGYVVSGEDNCPDIFNPDQLDTDENGIGDVCEEISEDCPDSISILSLLTPIDPNPVNTLIEANAVIDEVSVAEVYWNWGDGSSTTHSTLSEVFSASHVYTEAGVYRIELIVSDTCGNTDTTLSEYIPVYDPSGGFVTGGGWIWSPAGAYSADPVLEGKASFGFVAKYKKGSNIPEGHTEFHFQAGNLNFNSTSYDAMRLIISGAKAQFKGVGTINGSGNYGFLVSAIDGELAGGSEWDKFRIKIWDLDNDGTIVYDNNVDEYDDNAEPATAISGGSIIIHKAKGKKSAEIATTVHSSDQVFDLKVWPNPFVKELNFKFSSPGELQGKLELFDVNGAKVVTLLNRTLKTGEMVDIQYVPVDIISGFYMYRLQLNDKVFTDLIIYKKN